MRGGDGARDAGPPASSPFDPGLQLERTLLAWQRTCLSLVIGSALCVRLLATVDRAPVVPVALGALVLSASGWATAVARYRRSHDSLVRDHRRLAAGGTLITCTAVAALLLAVGGATFVVTTGGVR